MANQKKKGRPLNFIYCVHFNADMLIFFFVLVIDRDTLSLSFSFFLFFIFIFILKNIWLAQF